jgi:hypothetical protein
LLVQTELLGQEDDLRVLESQTERKTLSFVYEMEANSFLDHEQAENSSLVKLEAQKVQNIKLNAD